MEEVHESGPTPIPIGADRCLYRFQLARRADPAEGIRIAQVVSILSAQILRMASTCTGIPLDMFEIEKGGPAKRSLLAWENDIAFPDTKVQSSRTMRTPENCSA